MSTGIEWTDETWNPVVGCAFVSPGCLNCYAARDTAGRLQHTPAYEGLAVRPADGGPARFTGELRFLPDRLGKPMRWRTPRRVFVNSMSDLFHIDVPDHFVARVFAVMAATPHHRYQVLTKRPDRMARMLGWEEFKEAVDIELGFLAEADDTPKATRDLLRRSIGTMFPWPLRNVWLGTSVENQRYADLRIPHLLAAPAAVRFLSCEPLLGPVDLRLVGLGGCPDQRLPPWDRAELDWVIVGGESGPGARPMRPAWARLLRDQCVEAGVPFFFKQWGEFGRATGCDRCCAFDCDHAMVRLGKKAAGRVLDGRTWDEMPLEVAR